MSLGRAAWVGVSIASFCHLLVLPSALAEPRQPFPPWPEASLGNYRWNHPMWPEQRTLNEHTATYAESWSGYALVRDSLSTTLPVAIPGGIVDGRALLAAEHGAVRFWISPNWTSADESGEGKGPGHYARLLEMVNWGGTAPQTHWSLHVSEDGSAIYFTGVGKGGATDFLNVPIRFHAGEWTAVTICYSPTNSALWLNDQLVAEGEGVCAATYSDASSFGLVVGSDIAAANPAEAHFEDLTVFDYWPSAKQQTAYYKAVSKRAILGPVGTEEEEQAKQAMVQMMMESEGPPPVPGEGGGGEGDGGVSACAAYDYPSNMLWLEITGVSNGFAYVTIHGTVPENVYELLSKESLTNGLWISEGTVYGADGLDWTPTIIPVFDRTNSLFLWARSWIDSDGGGLPDWWQLEYFGSLGVDPYGDPDGDGWMNIEEYQKGTQPNSFNAGRAPAGFIAWIGGAGQQVELSWSIPLGNITGFLIERDTGVGFQSLGSVGAVNSSYTDYYAVTNDYTFYRIKANYAGGSSAYSEAVNPVIEPRYSVEAAIVRGPGGRLFLVASHIPAEVTALRVSRQVYNGFYPITDEANFVWEDRGEFDPGVSLGTFDVPSASLTNGIIELPISEVPFFGEYYFSIQALCQNGKKGRHPAFFYFRQDAAQTAENLAIPFLDGREHIGQNVEFLLRVGKGSSDAFGWEEPFHLEFESDNGQYREWGHPDYVYAGFHYYDEWYARLWFDEFQPFEQNKFFSNFVFSTSNVSTNGGLTTGADWDFSHWIPDYVYRVTNPVSLFSVYDYVINPNTNSLGAVLSANAARWLFLGGTEGLGFFGWDLQSFEYTVPNESRNLYGLRLNSVKWPGLYLPATFPTAARGETLYVVPGAYFVELERPILSTGSYYFARHDVEPLPGEQDFPVTNSTPLLITNVGAPFFLTAWAKQSILNGYANKFAFPEQYFDKAYRMNTNGVATTNETGILSPYGEFFPTEPGPTALLTLPDAATGARGTAVVHVISLNVDGNHDGVMDFSWFGPDQATPNRPYRFWTNDDDDADETKGDDIPGQNSTKVDYRDKALAGLGEVDGVRDLVDFFPVYLNIQSVLQAFPQNAVSVFLKQEDNALNYIVPSWYVDTDLSPTNCLAYLTDTNVALEIGRIGLPSATTRQISDSGGLPLESAFVNKIRNEGKGMLLIEARHVTTKPLVLELRTNNQVFARAELPLSITGVEQMFRHKNLERAVWTNSTVGWPDRLSDADVPNEPETNGKNFVFMHGYNVNPSQARGWGAEIFKRLYWAGSKARFYAVSWRGYETQVFQLVSYNLQTNIVHAFESAPALASVVDNLPGETVIAGHSLGNMLASAAVTRFAATPAKYFIINGAVAMEAFDPDLAKLDDMVNATWDDYYFGGTNDFLFASEWHKLFPANDPRSQLTWRGIFTNWGNTLVYNFYSSGEQVLKNIPHDNGNFFSASDAAEFPWGCQEKLKGRMIVELLGSTIGGWEVNQTFDYPGYYAPNSGNPPLYFPDSPTNAAVIPPSQLLTKPFFKKSPADLFSSNATTAQNFAQQYHYDLLARAIPARTFGVGANAMGDAPDFVASINLQTLQTGWPSSRGLNFNWLHSDCRNVAYFFTQQFFANVVEIGALK